MASDLLSKWLTYWDPIHRGWTPLGIANGVCTTNGFFFPRIRGGYNLRRYTGGTPDATAPIVGAAGADTNTIKTFGWVIHEPGQSYVYRLTAVSGGGVENWRDEVVTVADFQVNGSWSGGRPNSPMDLRVTPAAGGKFLVRWTYASQGQVKAPAGFNVYTDGGSGEVDFGTVYRSVVYRVGELHYDTLSGSFPQGTRVGFAVRAEASSPVVEDTNGNIVFAWARASGPPINPTVVIDRA